MSTNFKLLRFWGKDPLGGLRSTIFLPKESCSRLLVCYSRLNSASNGTKQDNIQINSRLSLSFFCLISARLLYNLLFAVLLYVVFKCSLFHHICLCITINPTIMPCHHNDIIRLYCHGSI